LKLLIVELEERGLTHTDEYKMSVNSSLDLNNEDDNEEEEDGIW
jgi:hypothetical protein